MSIVLTEMYVVKAERQAEFTPLLNEFLALKKERPELFDGLNAWKLYRQEIGRPAGLYVEMWEYGSLAQMEETNARIHKDEGMDAIRAAFHQMVEPATMSESVWRPMA
jgi:hypothetical protein